MNTKPDNTVQEPETVITEQNGSQRKRRSVRTETSLKTRTALLRTRMPEKLSRTVRNLNQMKRKNRQRNPECQLIRRKNPVLQIKEQGKNRTLQIHIKKNPVPQLQFLWNILRRLKKAAPRNRRFQ